MKRWSIIEWLVYITGIWTACSNMSDNYSIFTVIHSLCEKPPPLSHTHQQLHYFLNQTMIIPKMTLNWSYQLHGNKTQRAPFLWMMWGGWTSFLTDKTITNNICNCIAFFYLHEIMNIYKPTLSHLSRSIYTSLEMYWNSGVNRTFSFIWSTYQCMFQTF